jgi:predicted nucleic acid-binding protein
VIVVDASAVVELVLNTSRAAGVRQALTVVREAHAPELVETRDARRRAALARPRMDLQ